VLTRASARGRARPRTIGLSRVRGSIMWPFEVVRKESVVGPALLIEPAPEADDWRKEDPGGLPQTLEKDFEKFHKVRPRVGHRRRRRSGELGNRFSPNPRVTPDFIRPLPRQKAHALE
jgi:hypothetical protein